MKFVIENMTCGSCVRHITSGVRALDPQATVEADVPARTITVHTVAGLQQVEKAIADEGYVARPI